MRASSCDPGPGTRLGCEPLEDRTTPTAAYGLSGASLIAFDTATPATSTATTITGVETGEKLVGIDFRAQDDALYALGVNATANTATLYTLDTATGEATAVGTPGAIAFVDAVGGVVDLPDASAGYSIDFNNVTDRLSVVTKSGLNFRVDPSTGNPVDGDTGLAGTVAGTNPDGAINGLPAGSTGVVGTAFATDPAQPGVATQYTLDAGSDALFTQDATKSGTQSGRVNLAGKSNAALNFTAVGGFDIAGGVGVAALTAGGSTHLYQINLATGATTDLGTAPAGLKALAVAPSAGSVAFTGDVFVAAEADGAVDVTLTRTGGTFGEVSVTVTATDGTATAGSDYTAGPYTVTFAAGQSTATLTIPLDTAGGPEGGETFSLALSAPTKGATLGAQATATVTITDDAPPPPSDPAPVVTDSGPPGIAIGTGVGGAVEVLNQDGTARFSFMPYGPEMTGGVRVVSADVTGDGVADVITAPVAGAAHVKVFDGATGAEIQSFLAFEPEFLGGITIAAGDVNADGKADIIVGTATGAAHVKVFSGATGGLLRSFIAYGGYTGGVTVAGGDVNGDGIADIVTGTATSNSHVKVFNGGSLVTLQSFFAFRGYNGGVNVAAGDVDGDGKADVVVGTPVGNSHVKVFDSATGDLRASFRAFEPAYTGGVSVSARDTNGDGLADILVGTATESSHVKGFDGATGAEMNGFLAFDAGFSGGVFIN